MTKEVAKRKDATVTTEQKKIRSAMIKRSDLVDPRIKHTDKEIALYNAEAYDKVAHSMIIIRGQEKWVPPDIKEISNDKRSS